MKIFYFDKYLIEILNNCDGNQKSYPLGTPNLKNSNLVKAMIWHFYRHSMLFSMLLCNGHSA